MIVQDREYQDAKVLDTDGQVYSLSQYLTIREECRNRRINPFLAPCTGDA